MPTKDELAAEVEALRARLAELESDGLEGLREELAAAKEAARANPGDDAARERLAAASAAINQARAAARVGRPGYPTIGGDAFIDGGEA